MTVASLSKHAIWCFLILSITMVGCGAAPTPSFDDSTARLPAGAKKGIAILRLKIDGLDAKQLADAQLLGDVLDAGRPAEPTKVAAKIGMSEVFPPGPSARYWIYRLALTSCL